MAELEKLTHDFNLEWFAPLDIEQIHFIWFYIRRVNKHLIPKPGPDENKNVPLVYDWDDLEFYVNSQCVNSAPLTKQVYRQALGNFLKLKPRTPDSLWQLKYSILVQVFPDTWLTFMNYGYYDFESGNTELMLDGLDEDWRLAVQLYNRLVGAVEVEGKDVLEVGCGRGGGASFISRYLHPRSYTGVDGTRSNIIFCKTAHDVPNLSFKWSKAEVLTFPDASFDVVINLESCNYYQPFSRFVDEVYRVLRPKGYLLFSTYDHPQMMRSFREECEKRGFELLETEDVSTNVIRAMEVFDFNNDVVARHQAVRRKSMYIPSWNEISEVPGIHSGFQRYYRFALRKTT